MLGKEYSVNELIFGIVGIIGIIYVSQQINITLFQFLMIIIVTGTIIMISLVKKSEIEKLKTTNKLNETNNKSLLNFVDSINYFKLYNQPVYESFIEKLTNYIKLQKFIDDHNTNNYKLFNPKILNENLQYQKKDILETFISF
jgi:hypothetical protein